MLELKLWILTGVNGILLPFLIFFAARWMKENDKQRAEYEASIKDLYKTMNQVSMSIADIRLAIEQNKSWMCEKFISEKEFVRRMEDMKEDLKEVQTRAGVFNGHGNGK